MRLLVLFIFAGEFCVRKGDSWRLGDRKVWLPDLEFMTKGNWISDKVPTKNSRIKFPLEIQHSVGLPLTGDFAFSGIELPHDGSLLLPLNGGLQLTEPKGKGNKNNNPEIFEWKWKGPFSWVDPENWSGSNKAVPHLEKIPCGRDMVILPSYNRSLSIKLPTVDVNVKEVKIGKGAPLESWDWQEVMRGREFTNSHWSVKYSGSPYCDKCLCRHNTNINDLMNEICEIERPRCLSQEIACSYPIGVEGHCCSYCGGQLSLSVNHATFPLSKLNEITNEALKSYDDISHHVRVTLNENVEVLVTENGVYTGIKSAEAVDTLQRVFAERGISVLSYAVTGAPLKGSALATALGPLFGIPLVIIILILIAIPSFGYSYREVYSIFRASIREGSLPHDDPDKEGNFGFARFENIPEGEVQLASAVIPEDDMDSDDDDYEDGKRFENPLYRSKRKGPVEKIIDIDGPVSLAELAGKVTSHEDANIDSD
ncbi:protein amnionless-like [Diachasma alloeum]|uniref:protein amnionless-like n=1 Tax=Diachasma alloeum TaxID=454923 RepID=UPI0007384DC7|nr:protein amnionless-like [Diachasma alloeum]